MSNLVDGKPTNVSGRGWNEDAMKHLWNSLFDVAAVSSCNENDEDTQGMAMLLATILSVFKRYKRTAEQAKSAPCSRCPELEDACSRYKTELQSLKQKATLMDKIQRLMGVSASTEERTAALGIAMTQMFDTLQSPPDSIDDGRPKRKRSGDSPQDMDNKPPMKKQPLFNLSVSSHIIQSPCKESPDKSKLSVDNNLDHESQQRSDNTPNKSSQRKLLDNSSPRQSPRKKAGFQFDENLLHGESSTLGKQPNLFNVPSALRENVVVLVPETLPAAPCVRKPNIIIPETLSSQAILDDTFDTDCDETQMPLPLTPEKQSVAAEPNHSPLIGCRNNTTRLNRSFESRNSPKVHRIDTTPDVASRRSIASPLGPSPSLLQDNPITLNTSRVKSKALTENVGGSLSLKNGPYRQPKTSKVEPGSGSENDIMELPQRGSVVKKEDSLGKRKIGNWQLRPTPEVETISLDKRATKLRQTKLSLVSVVNNDLCSSREFNGGIRPGQTSTQMPAVESCDPDYEHAIMLSLIEAEKEAIIESKLPARFLETLSRNEDFVCPTEDENPEPEELLAEMALPSSLRTRALVADFDKIPRKKAVEPTYAYQRDAVRKQSERMKLDGQDCPSCRQYYQGMDMDEAERKMRLNKCSKHRNNFPRSTTPPGYWDTKFMVTQECRERNLDVTQSGQPLRSRKTRQQP